MVLHARGGFGREQVAARGLEEVEHGLVFERGRIGHVDHHLRARERFDQAFAGERVDARLGRGRHGLVAALLKKLDELAADEAGAADDNDFHEGSFA